MNLARTLALWSLLSCASAWAQPSPPCADARAPYRFLRMEEDFRFLRDPACRTGMLDGLKYLALDAAGERYLTLGGDVRLKVASGRDVLFADDPGSPDHAFSKRIHAHASLRLAPTLRLFAEVKHNDVEGREPRPLPVDVNRGDLHQAFADIAAGPFMLRTGRQEIVYGSGRRIFPRNGPNVRGSFDGARLTWRGAHRLDLFAFHPVEVDPGSFDDSPVRTQKFMGAHGTLAAGTLAPAPLDFYWIRSERDAVRFSQGAGDETRNTLGARLARREGPWDYDHEVNVQWGRFAGGSIRAWALQLEGGHTFTKAAAAPRLGLRLDAASGDRDPASRRLETFHALLPRGGVVSDAFNFSPANLMHVRPSVDAYPVAGLRLALAMDASWRQSRRDGLYGPPGNVLRAAGTSRARAVGSDVELRAVYTWSRHVTIDALAAQFAPGDFLRESGAGRRQLYGTLTAHLRF